MDSFEDLLRQAEIAHGHLCAGQSLGVRMAMLGCERLGIAEPRTSDRKRLVTFVEIDRCATDAIGVVTGCRLGKRALKVKDWGKMAATWGSASDVAELNRLFDTMQKFCKHNDLPAFIGEFGVTGKKEMPSRVRWMSAVIEAALSRKMIPVLWDTGGDLPRTPPYGASPALREVLGQR